MHTISVVEKLCDVQSAAGGPRRSLAQPGELGSHDMILSLMSKKLLAILGIVMRHAQNMT